MYGDEPDTDNSAPVASAPAAPPPQAPKKRKAPELPLIERRNWLIHVHYARKETAACKALIEEQLTETNGTCDYALYTKGLILREEGKIQESLDVFQKCALADNKSVEYLRQTARTLGLLGKHKGAVDLLEEATNMAPDEVENYFWKATSLHHMGETKMAKEVLKKGLVIGKHEKSWMLLAKILRSENDILSAIEAYKKALECSPESSDILTTLGLLYMKVGSDQQAFEALGKALGFNPSHAGAILAAGCMMQEHEDYDVALSKYRTAAEQWPDSAQLWNNIAMCFYGKKKFVAAMSCLKRANYLAPLDWKILANLGKVHMAMKQNASAFNFFSAAINLQPKVASLYGALAVVLVGLNDMVNAGKAYQKAMSLDKNDPTTPLNYSVLLLKNHEQQQAAAMYKEFVDRRERLKDPKTGAYKVDDDVTALAQRVQGMLSNAEDKASVNTLNSMTPDNGGGGALT